MFPGGGGPRLRRLFDPEAGRGRTVNDSFIEN